MSYEKAINISFNYYSAEHYIMNVKLTNTATGYLYSRARVSRAFGIIRAEGMPRHLISMNGNFKTMSVLV